MPNRLSALLFVTLIGVSVGAGAENAPAPKNASSGQEWEAFGKKWREYRKKSHQQYLERMSKEGGKAIKNADVSPDIHEDKPYQPPQKVRATLGLWRLLGIKILEVFPGPGGTTGIRAKLPPGRALTFYMNPDGGEFTIAGEIRAMPAAGQSTSRVPGIKGGNRVNVTLETLEFLPSIRQGAVDDPDVPVLWVIVDFGCLHCFRFFDVVQEVLREEPFEVRWVPVAFGGPVSQTAAAWAWGGETTPEDLRELFKMTLFKQGRKDVELLTQDRKRLITGTFTMEKVMSIVKRMDVHATPYLFRVKNGYIEALEGGLETRLLKMWVSAPERTQQE
ncbi:DsbA family protein [Thiolapillus sp.]|uniref:DsbA family protein n=1 Tax=Thiolapillus sp. TaxID=2017437 RepID=UPI0025FE1BA0|nr:DsbA family protein [Thiolapillus sp.]